MKSPFFSIVIPAYNCRKSIIKLLDSVIKSGDADLSQFEVIVVDDKSKDRTVQAVKSYLPKMRRKLASAKIVALEQNSGPAKARNIGVSHSKGKIVLFLDSDVILAKGTLKEIITSFRTDPDLYAMTGVWSKIQKSRKFFPKFKALRDWSYWINERDPKNYYYLFSTRVAAINRKLFNRLGGFDVTYKAALIEDIELTYRIAKRYAVVFNPKAMVYHEFEDFLPIAKKYFWRSYYWSKIYRERKKFDPVATTGKEALTTMSAGAMVGLLVFSIVAFIGNFSQIFGISIAGFAFATLLHFWGVRKFIYFSFREEGILFAVKSFVVGIILYIVILSGALFSILPIIK
jgi:glycosyltransferase involved in cell wall biosynthesis